MNRLVITVAVAVAAIGGGGAALIGALWPSGPGDDHVAPVQRVVAVDPLGGSDPAAPGGTAAAGGAGAGAPAAGQDAAGAPQGAAAGMAASGIVGGGTAGSAAAGTSSTGSSGTGSAGSSGSGSSGSGSGEPSCGLGRWDARVQGRPVGFAGGERAGDYLWHDATGFHLAVTHRGDRRDVFTGTIQANAAMAMRPVRLEGRDAVALSADRHTLYFRFYDYGHVDAVDFVTDCASRLVVGTLRMDRLALPTDRVYLGADRAHPARVPFTLTRA